MRAQQLVPLVIGLVFNAFLWWRLKVIAERHFYLMYEHERQRLLRVYLLGPTRESLVVWAEYDEAVQADVTARMFGHTRPVDDYLKRECASVNAWHTKPPGEPWKL